jgi:hypothetical protein
LAKEQVDGDLKTAMDAYQKIAADPAASRDLRCEIPAEIGRMPGEDRSTREDSVRENRAQVRRPAGGGASPQPAGRPCGAARQYECPANDDDEPNRVPGVRSYR